MIINNRFLKYIGVIGLLALTLVVANPVSAALPDTIYQVDGTAIIVADTTDYAGDLGTRTDQIDLTSVAAGAARQSAKLDFTANRATFNSMYAALEYAVAPLSGAASDFYLCFSPDATAGTANTGGSSGSDEAYTGTAGDSLDDSIKQCSYIGSHLATADATTVVQFQAIGTFRAVERYANLVVVNNTAQAYVADAVESGVRILPLTTQIQE